MGYTGAIGVALMDEVAGVNDQIRVGFTEVRTDITVLGRDMARFRKGYLCYNCLLPTVSIQTAVAKLLADHDAGGVQQCAGSQGSRCQCVQNATPDPTWALCVLVWRPGKSPEVHRREHQRTMEFSGGIHPVVNRG